MSTQQVASDPNAIDVFVFGRKFSQALRSQGFSGDATKVDTILQEISAIDTKGFLTVPQVAEKYNFSEAMINKIVQDGGFESIYVDDVVYIPKSELKSWDEIDDMFSDLPIPSEEEVDAIISEYRREWRAHQES